MFICTDWGRRVKLLGNTFFTSQRGYIPRKRSVKTHARMDTVFHIANIATEGEQRLK